MNSQFFALKSIHAKAYAARLAMTSGMIVAGRVIAIELMNALLSVIVLLPAPSTST